MPLNKETKPSINKANFVNRKHCLQMHFFFQGNQCVMSLFMSQKTVNMDFFTEHKDQNVFFTGESVSFQSRDCLFDSCL